MFNDTQINIWCIYLRNRIKYEHVRILFSTPLSLFIHCIGALSRDSSLGKICWRSQVRRRRLRKGFFRQNYILQKTNSKKPCIDHRKKIKKFQISLKNEDLFRNIPEELKDLKFIFEEVENLEFEERPHYDKIITFIKNHAHFGKGEWFKLYSKSLHTGSHVIIACSKNFMIKFC